jgi:hypothetical protein
MANMRALSAALIDTNILIYQLNNSLPIGVQQALGLKLEAGQAFVSVITHIELPFDEELEAYSKKVQRRWGGFA